MSDKHETTDDIIREMRDLGALDEQCGDMIPRSLQALGLRTYADRFEAAEREHNRQYEPKCNWSIKDALALANTLANHGLRDGNADAASSCIYSLCRNLSSPGNAAALRRALEDTEELLEHFAKPGTMLHSAFFLHMRDNRAALAAPPRNCDVGTAEEQSKRFGAMCNKYYDDENECDKGCPLAQMDFIHGFPRCQAFWAQMPYVEEETSSQHATDNGGDSTGHCRNDGRPAKHGWSHGGQQARRCDTQDGRPR